MTRLDPPHLHQLHGGGEHGVLRAHAGQLGLGGRPEQLHDDRQLVPGVLALQQRPQQRHLGQHAAQAPHVHRHAVVTSPQQQLGGPVEPANGSDLVQMLIVSALPHLLQM